MRARQACSSTLALHHTLSSCENVKLMLEDKHKPSEGRHKVLGDHIMTSSSDS